MTVIAHYYFKTSGHMLQPYIGAGLGAQYTEMHAYYNIYVSTDNNWAFVVRPELGTFISFGQSPTKGMVSIGYNVAYNNSDALNIDHIKQFTLNVGLVGIK
jgi:outer membrane protein W